MAHVFSPFLFFLLSGCALLASSLETRISANSHFESFLEKLSSSERGEIIARFQAYLQIDTRHPISEDDSKPDYASAVGFVESFVDDHFVQSLVSCSRVYATAERNKPMVVVHFPGNGPRNDVISGCDLTDSSPTSAKSVLLSSHMDVVSTPNESNWSSAPMNATIDSEERIIARGSQDMKSIGMAYLEAMRMLTTQEFPNRLPNHDVRILFTVDEEMGSADGMGSFIRLQDDEDLFGQWNVGFGLDEGIPTPDEGVFDVYFGERSAVWIKFVAEGPGGHGSQFVADTATHRLIELGHRILEFRETQVRELAARGDGATIGDFVSFNIDALKSGVRRSMEDDESFSANVIPTRAIMVLDVRYPPSISWQQMKEKLLDVWAAEFKVTWEIVSPHDEVNPVSNINDELFLRMQSALQRIGFRKRLRTFQAGTDARFGRLRGVNMFGITPADETPVRLHAVDEFLHLRKYLQMVFVYREILRDVLYSQDFE